MHLEPSNNLIEKLIFIRKRILSWSAEPFLNSLKFMFSKLQCYFVIKWNDLAK